MHALGRCEELDERPHGVEANAQVGSAAEERVEAVLGEWRRVASRREVGE